MRYSEEDSFEMRSWAPKDVDRGHSTDIQPRPLRIAKRKPISTFANPNATPRSHIYPTIIPTRRSSTVTVSTQLDNSLSDHGPLSQGTDFGNIQAMESTSVSKPRPAEPLSRPPWSRSVSDIAIQSARKVPSPASALLPLVSTLHPNTDAARNCFNAKASDLLNPVKDDLLIPLATTPFLGNRRRAVTTGGYGLRHDSPERLYGNETIGRQRSLQHRLLTRVISGLTNKANTCYIKADDSHTISNLQHENRSRSSRYLDSVRSSIVSTDTYCSSELGGALAAFPSPPASNCTFPTSTGRDESSQTHSKIYRDLDRPQGVAVLGAELILTPEYDELISGNEQSMFVLVRLKATMSEVQKEPNMASMRANLDIVVVIDNSFETSPATLMASCETARLLATTLDDTLDRMAIVCSSTMETSAIQNTLVAPLSQLRMPQLKAALDTITISSVAANTSTFLDAINVAHTVLTQQPPSDQTKRLCVFGHIFLLTANEGQLPSLLTPDNMTQVHIVCPGSIPRKSQGSNHFNGWRLRGLNGCEPGLLATKGRGESHGLFHDFRSLLQHARSGVSPSLLTDLTLDITPGQKCCVERIIGDSDFSTLQAGEDRNILVKVRINTPPASGYSLSYMPHLETTAQPTDLFGELDTMLGNFPIAVLTATLSYRNSGMPPKIVCSVSAKCELMRHLSTLCSAKEPMVRELPQIWKSTDRASVHEAFASYLASHYNPQDALFAIITEFGEKGYRSLCPKYIICLVKELRYQTRIFERRAIQNSPRKLKEDTFVSGVDRQLGHFDQKSNCENFKPRDWLIISDEEDSPAGGTKKDLWAWSRTRSKKANRQEHHQIWAEPKKKSKTRDANVLGEPAIGLETEQGNKTQVAEIALRNKKSFGTSSFRRLTSPKQGRTPFAPLR